jgi:hypothetical protein
MNRPSFLTKEETSPQPPLPLADFQAVFQRNHELIIRRDYSADTETKIILLANQLQLVFQLLVQVLQRKII